MIDEPEIFGMHDNANIAFQVTTDSMALWSPQYLCFVEATSSVANWRILLLAWIASTVTDFFHNKQIFLDTDSDDAKASDARMCKVILN